MGSTILVIDSNAAVQAITALALSETGCAIEQLTEGAHAIERISKLRPTVVLIAKELTGVDPMQVPERMRPLSPETRYILLAPADGSTALEARATQAGFSEVLFKPFKSNRLREVVNRLLAPTLELAPTAGADRASIFLDIADKFLISLFQRLFSRTDADILLDPSVDRPVTVTVTHYNDSTAPTEPLPGRHLVLCTADKRDAAQLAFPHAVLLTLPFGTKELQRAVEGVLTFSLPPARSESQPPSADIASGHAQLAARISAAIFEQLLLEPALREHDWDGAASLARAATLRIVNEQH